MTQKQTDNQGPLRIAVVGCGWIAKAYHGPSLRRYAQDHPHTRLLACCDTDADRAREFAARFGFEHWTTNIDEMLDQHTPDVVCLYVPERLTCALTCHIAQRRYPLLTEKPPGLTLDELNRMINAVEKSGVYVDVAFNRRHMPLVRELMHGIVSCDAPAQLQHIQYEMIRFSRKDADFATTAIHGIDLVRHVARSPYRAITFRYLPQPQLGPTVANMHLLCEFASGTTASLSFCPTAGAIVERLSAHLQDHSFYVELPVGESFDALGRFRHVGHGKVLCDISGADLAQDNDPSIKPALASGFYNETVAFLDGIRHRTASGVPLRDARQVMRIVEAIRGRERQLSFEPQT